MDAQAIVNAIHREMDGKEWSADTLDRIAELLKGAGYEIRDAYTPLPGIDYTEA